MSCSSAIILLSKFNFAVCPRVQDFFVDICSSIPHDGLLGYPLTCYFYIFIIYWDLSEVLSVLYRVSYCVG